MTQHLDTLSLPKLVFGGFGNDTLNGSSTQDWILGLTGNDRIYGRAGNDFLSGGFGNDTLDGGTGTNTLSGGPGQDCFILNTDSGFDRILDFKDGSDRLVLEDGLTFSQLAITQVGSDTQIRYLGNSSPTAVLKNFQASRLTADDFLTTPVRFSFTSLTVFGDSLSDPGNLFALTQNQFPPPPYSEGRFSNGQIWANVLPTHLGLSPNQVSNFAYGGATTGRDNGLEPFLGGNLPGLLDEVDQYTDHLGASGADPNGLYVVWAGPNDFFNLPSDPSAIPSVIAQSVSNIATAITDLASRGADTFLVPNLPNLGLLPRSLSAGTGAAAAATAISAAYNQALAATLSTLEQSLSIGIVNVDIFSLTQELINRGSEFGFTNVTTPLILQPPATTNPNQFFFWDDTHPTTRVQQLLADTFETTLVKAGYGVNEPLSSTAAAGTSIDWNTAAAEAELAQRDAASLSSLGWPSYAAFDRPQTMTA